MTTKITTDNIQPNTVVSYSEFTQNLLPKVSNVSVANSTYAILDDTAVNVGGGYIVITGGGFQDGATVLISGTQATSVSYVNASTLHAQVPTKSAATYNLYVVNPDGGTAIGANKLTYSGVPTWVTDTLTNWQLDVAANVTFDATGATSYSNTTALPLGTTLLSNGYFYGTVTGIESETTYNFTIRATDAENQDSDKSFSLTVTTVQPRAFTISPAVSGKTSWDLDVDGPLDLTTAGTWTITPTSDINTCNIQAWGAQGKRSVTVPIYGQGGYMGADFVLTENTSYVVIVGSAAISATGGTPGGGNASSPVAGGGGGLSGVFTNSYAHANSLIIGGGGGGAGQTFGGQGGGDTAQSGGSITSGGYSIFGGAGGSQASGGIASTAYPWEVIGNSGSALTGAAGKNAPGWASGAGGGGYYGGASGNGAQPSVPSTDRNGGGGGGGSGYIHPSAANAAKQNGLQEGDGRILIT